MKDRKYESHSGCLETLCHVRGPLRNKMATLVVIPSRSDSDPSADPVPDQTMHTRSLFKWMALKKALGMSDSVKLTVGSIV